MTHIYKTSPEGIKALHQLLDSYCHIHYSIHGKLTHGKLSLEFYPGKTLFLKAFGLERQCACEELQQTRDDLASWLRVDLEQVMSGCMNGIACQIKWNCDDEIEFTFIEEGILP